MSTSARARSITVHSMRRPKSFADLVDSLFLEECLDDGREINKDTVGLLSPIRQLFAQARQLRCQSVIVEDVPPEGPVLDENTEIREINASYRMTGLLRISFWTKTIRCAKTLQPSDGCYLIGFALVKRDSVHESMLGKWHIFESVIRRVDSQDLYVPVSNIFRIRVGNRSFDVCGVLFCEQNGLNKRCAQVALRSICVTYLGDAGLSYRFINKHAEKYARNLARREGKPYDWVPNAGLDSGQITRVLNKLNIPFAITDYNLPEGKLNPVPYSRLVYSGVESGSGSLLAFMLSGPGADEAGPTCHIIPIFGHTFTRNAWSAHADGDYFKSEESVSYLSSAAWAGNFVGHDDNYGSNLTVPSTFTREAAAVHVIALRPNGFAYSGLEAEIAGSGYFLDLFFQIISKFQDLSDVRWMKRLKGYVASRKLILRAVANTRADYIAHLKTVRDWRKTAEDPMTVEDIEDRLSNLLWVVEVSVPELFSTNKRKLGELVLDATLRPRGKSYRSLRVMRLPGLYLYFDGIGSKGEARFIVDRSLITSSTPLQDKRAPNR